MALLSKNAGLVNSSALGFDLSLVSGQGMFSHEDFTTRENFIHPEKLLADDREEN
ncbi:hypothetical protein PGTUg99_015323 [Puccinia graminis f. sp. tritici]|uniref:Uncharacterized protein n=1 Tax=Puccinia graminis f. sp. tritici TaxID=56615 RepID=A0A5B0S1K6_PUCGR|nr:hypothetical protein PGTUg99_015323 [Puccinia graminis f. sp. tritici]